MKEKNKIFRIFAIMAAIALCLALSAPAAMAQDEEGGEEAPIGHHVTVARVDNLAAATGYDPEAHAALAAAQTELEEKEAALATAQGTLDGIVSEMASVKAQLETEKDKDDPDTDLIDQLETRLGELAGSKTTAEGVVASAQEAVDNATENVSNLAESAVGVSPEDIAAMREEGMGWGQIAHELGVHPGTLGLGHTKRFREGATEETAGDLGKTATLRSKKGGISPGHGVKADGSSNNGKGLGKTKEKSNQGKSSNKAGGKDKEKSNNAGGKGKSKNK